MIELSTESSLSDFEEEIENITQELNDISTTRKIGYYSLLTIGTLTMLNEIPIGKFCFDTSMEAINQTYAVFFNETSIPPFITVPAALIPTILGGISSILSLQLIKESREIAGIIKSKDGKLQRFKSVHDESEMIDPALSLPRKSFNWLIFTGIPYCAMSINFINGALAGSLSINEALSSQPILKYSLTPLSFLGGMGYSILVSYQDILRNFKLFQNISDSPIGLLFSYSKMIALMPTTRLLVSLTSDVAIYDYIARKVCNEIFNLPDQELLFSIASISSCITVRLGTQLIPAFTAYLSPFQTSENTYDLTLFEAGLLNDVDYPLSFKDKTLLMLSTLPLGLIRGVGVGFFSYQLIRQWLDPQGMLNIYGLMATITASSLIGLTFSAHTIYSDYQTALSFKQKTLLFNQPDLLTEEIKSEENDSGSASLAFIINLGSQVAYGFLGVASITTLFGPILGEEAAATLGMFVALEKGWVNFRYFQPKMKNQISDLWNQRPLFSNRFNFFKKQSSSTSEIVELYSSDDTSNNEDLTLPGGKPASGFFLV